MEVVEHRSIGFLKPGDDVAKVTHHLYFQFIERKLWELGIEVLQEDWQLVPEVVELDQDERLHVGVMDEIQVVRGIVGAWSSK